MERKIVKDILIITLLVSLLSGGVPFISQAEEAAVTPEREKAAVEPQAEKKAIITLKASSDKVLSVEMINSVPVRGAQFTIGGVKITEVRTTKRTAGFLAKFNENNGAVILLSTSGNKIAPGKGSIAEVICDQSKSAQLSAIKIAGGNREPL